MRQAGITLKQLWREQNFEPNENQQRAILHVNGPLYLPAGPGSGKTRVLLWRTLNLIVFHAIQPEEIFLSTFTQKAALQLKEGLRSLLSIAAKFTGMPYDLSKMYVGTVHSLCQRLIADRRFFAHRQRGKVPAVLDELNQFTLQLEAVFHQKARISITISDTSGEHRKVTHDFNERESLARRLNDERLRNFQLLEIHNGRSNPRVIFHNKVELTTFSPFVFESEAGQTVAERTEALPITRHTIFNLIDRAARETGLTRPTINQIFKGLTTDLKRRLFRNPEGFASLFIQHIRETLADHIAERIKFSLEDGKVSLNLGKLFPIKKDFVQRELVEAGEKGLYDWVQTDSNNERVFVARVKPDEKIVFYFKFPASFKIKLPKVIGDYNPDWGIVRHDDRGKLILQLVRETKFREEAELRFPHEKRKVESARRHFRAMKIDYRPVFPDFEEWWRSENEVTAQGSLEIGELRKNR